MKVLAVLLTVSFLPSTPSPQATPSPQDCVSLAPTEFVRHVNAAGRYTVELPKGWEVQAFDDDVNGRNPRTDGCLSASAAVTTERLDREVGVDAFLDERLPFIRRMSPNWTESERTAATLSGVPAKKFVYSHTTGNVRWTFLVYVTVKGRNAYLMQCGARADLFDQYKSACERIAQSFTFQ